MRIKSAYTLEPKGFWARIANWIWVTPRSSGVPLNTKYRPLGGPPHNYQTPETAPAADVAGNAYFARDTRRAYPRTLMYDQSHVAGLLTLGSVDNPKIADGETGTTQLAKVNKLKLTQVLSKKDGITQLLQRHNGLPPFPGPGPREWRINTDQGYSAGKHLRLRSLITAYPVRAFS